MSDTLALQLPSQVEILPNMQAHRFVWKALPATVRKHTLSQLQASIHKAFQKADGKIDVTLNPIDVVRYTMAECHTDFDRLKHAMVGFPYCRTTIRGGEEKSLTSNTEPLSFDYLVHGALETYLEREFLTEFAAFPNATDYTTELLINDPRFYVGHSPARMLMSVRITSKPAPDIPAG
jgi:hypothetical protein